MNHRDVLLPEHALREMVRAAIEEGCGDRIGAAIAHIEMICRNAGIDLRTEPEMTAPVYEAEIVAGSWPGFGYRFHLYCDGESTSSGGIFLTPEGAERAALNAARAHRGDFKRRIRLALPPEGDG